MELEDFPVPRAVRVNGRTKVHLAELGSAPCRPECKTAGVALCGSEGELTVVEMEPEEIDELPLAEKCLRCASAANGRARIKRLT